MKGVKDMALYPRSFSASGLPDFCRDKIKPLGYKAMSIKQYERVHGH
ncbi:MAG: hypothetical protein FD156_2587 [Nitrospirae bacterium]|nr:MAG: hypothetical protein FD156_2587 [Nitrospirota bacterium]